MCICVYIKNKINWDIKAYIKQLFTYSLFNACKVLHHITLPFIINTYTT